MRKILIFLMLGLLSFPGITQNVTNDRAKELFGYRYISPSEAGFPDNLEIPFSEEALKYDFLSWLVPMNIDGLVEYRLIRAVSPNQNAQSDTLNLLDARKMICLLARIRPSFPNENGENEVFKYFFRVRDKTPSKFGMEFRKTIAQNDDLILIVNLPSLAQAGVLKSNYISYLINDIEGQSILGFETLPSSTPPMTERFISILTLTYSQ